MAQRRKSRLVLTLATALLVGGALAAAFWPRPMMVDIGTVTRGPMRVTIDEEARTRVRDPYVVSAPVTGRLMRVEVDPGTEVVRGETVVARMRPVNPAALDVRTREQARAAVAAAEAALRVAQADLNRALADRNLVSGDLARTRALAERGSVAQAALERAEATARAAEATVDTARAAVSMRIADLENAQAQLIGFDDPGLAAAIGANADSFPLFAPTTGRILRVIQQSETTLPVGTPILEIGNIEDGLEVVAELLSTDAVQVRPGDRVEVVDWGGAGILPAEVARIDPFGITKFSALGVEEQRVNAIIRFTGPAEARAGLGHGYRVEVRIIVWEKPDAVIVPANALFRQGEDWAAFRVEDGSAVLRPVGIGRSNGTQAEVTGGLEPGDRIVLYPSAGLADGQRVAQRTVE